MADSGQKISGNLEGFDNQEPQPLNIESLVNYDIDILHVYYGDPVELASGIILKQPTIREIKEFGEKKFWRSASSLCANPTSYRVMLWDQGIDWCKLEDFDFFFVMMQGLTSDDSSLFFENIDLTQFADIRDEEGKLILIYLPDPDIQIDEDAYKELVSYLRIFFGINPKTEITKGKLNKEILILEEKNRMAREAWERKNAYWEESQLFPLISSAVNHEGFKYSIEECLDLTIFQFMDAVKRQSVIQEAHSLMTGMYSGMVDIKQNNLTKALDWTRDIYV